jgi:hypothetical protein
VLKLFQNEPGTPGDDLEAMVRAAGHYVRASDDLRPRVLEAVRAQRGERRARRWIARSAAAVIALMLLSAYAVAWLQSQDGLDEFSLTEVERQQAVVQGGMAEGGGWPIVKAFADLRQRQTEVLAPGQ